MTNQGSARITAVILSWKRPDGVQHICQVLEQEPLIGEIIIWNNNPDIYLEKVSEKARVINCTADFGLFTRFAGAALASNDCILYHDDDIIAPSATLETLYESWLKAPYVCHSPFGRNPKNDQYSLNSQYGCVEIILTRYVLVHRDVCVRALAATPEFSDIPGEPAGNGEDIILSYAAMAHSGKLNRSYRLKTGELEGSQHSAISERFGDHLGHRSKVIRRCKKVFGLRRRLLLGRVLYQFGEKIKIVMERNGLRTGET